MIPAGHLSLWILFPFQLRQIKSKRFIQTTLQNFNMWDFREKEDLIEEIKDEQIVEILKGLRKNDKPKERNFNKGIYKQNNINISSMKFYLENHFHGDIQEQ